jgi:putative transposase
MVFRPEYPYKGFETLDTARGWTLKFVHWYNCMHLHSGINFVTPEQCHTGAYLEVLKMRKEVYELAKQKRPERWSGSTRDWSPHASVALNPMKESKDNSQNASNDLSSAVQESPLPFSK